MANDPVPHQAMAWNEDGKLVPMDDAELARQLAIARKESEGNAKLPEPVYLSDKESRFLVWRDVAHLMDEFFSAVPWLGVLLAVAPLASLFPVVLWGNYRFARVILPLALLVAGFRFWIWWRERGRD